jgi:PAS domain S-box-containing protein
MAPSKLADPARLALLKALDLLRPHHDASFDRVTTLAALATGRPTALLTFVSPDGQWVASRVGWAVDFHPLSESFCLHAIEGDDQLLEVCDATSDPRFEFNALVTGSAAVRFYAGHPVTFDGHTLGTVCVLDQEPGRLSSGQADALRHLAGLVSDLLRVRRERSTAWTERERAGELMSALELSRATLRESEERYRLLWQTTTDAVLIIDDTGIIQFANPAFETLFGRRPEDVVGLPVSTIQPKRLRQSHERSFEAYLRSGTRTMNWRGTRSMGLTADGKEIPIEIAFSEMAVGGKRVFAAFIRDVTERDRADAALRRSEAQFRSLTALSADWYWEVDSDFRFTFISEGARRSGLIVPEEVLGKRPWEVRKGADDERWSRQKAKVMRHEAFKDFEMVQQADDGSKQVLMISGEPVFDDHGVFMGYRGVGRNITEQRRAEEARRELEEHLLETQKLEAIGVLAGGIAHDFNNVLAGILGNAQLAIDDLPPEHPALQSLQQIRRAGHRGREMVQQILTFARRRPRRPEHCELHDLVDETLALLRPTVPKPVKIEASLPSGPLRVFADATQIEQALINLCANAWQAMAGRPGLIEISADEVLLDREAAERIGGLEPGRYVHLFVRDDGPGMDEATVKHAFEPFFTTKPEGEGTGLGLSMVHGIVTGHGGAVTVQTAKGEGCCFHIWLPADDDAVITEPARLEGQHDCKGGGQHVMYIDDDEVMRLMVGRLLERCGYVITTCADGREALLQFRAEPDAFHVIVTDLNMPEISGLDVLREAKAIRPAVPVIIGSGNFPEADLAVAHEFGVACVFHKQNTLEELPDRLAEALEEATQDRPVRPP